MKFSEINKEGWYKVDEDRYVCFLSAPTFYPLAMQTDSGLAPILFIGECGLKAISHEHEWQYEWNFQLVNHSDWRTILGEFLETTQ